MNHDVGEKSQPLTYFLFQILIGWSFEGPINEHRPSDHILLGNESPVAAVITDVTVVAHGKVVIGWDNQVVSLDVLLHQQLPVWSHVVEFGRRDGGEVVTIRSEEHTCELPSRPHLV